MTVPVKAFSTHFENLSLLMEQSETNKEGFLIPAEDRLQSCLNRCFKALRDIEPPKEEEKATVKKLYDSLNPKVSKLDSRSNQERFKELFQKIETHFSFPLVEEPSAALPKGSKNRSGSDCFANAFYQFVQVKELQEHFIAHLPEELYPHFATQHPNAKKIRTALNTHTAFALGQPEGGAGQQDVTEVLMQVASRLYAKDNSYNQIAPIEPQEALDLKEEYNRNRVIKLAIRIIDYISSFFDSIASFFDKFFSSQESEEPTVITDQRREFRQRRIVVENNTAENPLNVIVREKRKYTPNKNVPLQLRHIEDFGGETNESERLTSPEISLFLPLVKKTHKGYDFTTLITEFFKEEKCSPAQKTVKEGPLTGKAFRAGVTKEKHLTKAPDHLLLSFKRSSFHRTKGAIKISDPIQNIPLDYTLPASLGAEPRNYELTSFVTHLGKGSSSGHYICYRKEPSGKWFVFDDSQVKEVEEKEVLKAATQSYMLFYKGKN